MSREPGKFRHALNFLGITESAEDRRRRPVGSKAWWINTLALALFVMVFLFLLRTFVL